jgi:long-subunit acyl-CoA synthetase (AMP-forming)
MEALSKDALNSKLVAGSTGPNLIDWSQICKLGQQHPAEPPKHDNTTSMFTVAYTSGSTGRPKGAVNTYARWNKFITELYLMPNPLVRLSFMSIAHVTERQQFWLTLMNGGCMAFHNDGTP